MPHLQVHAAPLTPIYVSAYITSGWFRDGQAAMRFSSALPDIPRTATILAPGRHDASINSADAAVYGIISIAATIFHISLVARVYFSAWRHRVITAA